MAEHIWTILCERTLVDPKNQVISLIDVIESLSNETLELRLAEAERLGKKGAVLNTSMQLVSWWFRADPKEAELQARFVLLNPAGERVLTQTAKMAWMEDSTTLRLFINVPKVPVSAFGLHWFVVEQYKVGKNKKPSWVHMTKLPFLIDKA